MTRRGTSWFMALFTAFIFLAAAGCAGPLEVKYRGATDGFKAGGPATVLLVPFADKRADKGADPRTIGAIRSPVADMNSDRLTISEDVSALVTRAFEKELQKAGYTVKTAPDDAADFVLSGEVSEFRASVGARDEIAIAVSSTVEEAATGRVIWSGAEAERGERFAGVIGNTRATLSAYIAGSLSKAVSRSIAQAGARLENTRAAYAPAEKAVKAPPPPQGTGRLVVTTDPPRAKVYLDEVYYGLTPLNIDMDPGVYELTILHKGFKAPKEKVSVRPGQFTELEVEMERE